MARICREAGGRVRENVRLADMNVSVSSADNRRVEVLASGLPCRRGSQLAVDVTICSVVTRDGHARSQADWQDGASAGAARGDKEKAYPELARGDRCLLVVAAIEAGGRLSRETCELLRDLAHARAQCAPRYLRKATAFAYIRRWSKMLSISVASAVAQSIVCTKEELAAAPARSGQAPWQQDVLSAARLETHWLDVSFSGC